MTVEFDVDQYASCGYYAADVMGYQLMTTEDPKAEIEVSRSGTPAPMANARRWTLRRISGPVAGLAAVGTVLAGLTGYWTTYRTVTGELFAPVKPGPTAPAEAARFSIVVLPFANLSGDPSQDYFADAITENLTTGMSRIPKFPVIARNTAFTYKGKNIDVRQIGKDLGVRYVLEGSVQRDQNRARVNAQLIDAHSGAHLWADQFDTTRADPLQMQDEIVARINSTLRYELTKAEAQKSAIATNPDALDLATECVVSVLDKAGLFGKEATVCERALDADPNNVTALSMSSIGYTLAILLGRSNDPRVDLKRADELASRAIAVDANNPSGHLAKGNVLVVVRRFDDAIAEFERALALDPNVAEAYGALGHLYVDIGQYEKAIEFFDKAIGLSPQNQQLAVWYMGKGHAYFGLQQYDQAIEWARRSIAINPSFGSAFGTLAAALALTGHDAEARDAEQRRAALSKVKNVAALKALVPPSADQRVRASFDRAIEGLRKAGMPEE
ncbi:tetratricopeptide repeat protein [Bradyrhizobium sp. NAS80.1]|uniref:tetratricopeptide repeat protein n=1 Tax=Bradyrhizobium sp. NAS80.1 TaxID=1680159 RepID=UPI00143DFA19|nr:tetratricopeptide repeat protein [Bradyrhizobium sp. NAS80.1]